MSNHNLFYYPYASLNNTQYQLLKIAALYFDKLILLDPVGASWDSVGADFFTREAILKLKDAGILEVIAPEPVLAKYEAPLSDAIRRDMLDGDFLDLCKTQSQIDGKQRWTLSLAKVPKDIQTDQVMRNLMGDFAREVSQASGKYYEEIGRDTSRYHEFSETAQVYDEYREGYESNIEYRYADFPLALGEAIMMNHALFSGLLYARATPITDEPFHNRVLSHKLQRASQEPIIKQAVADRLAQRQQKTNLLAAAVLTDAQIKLPILNPAIKLDDVLEYRHKNEAALCQARDQLGWMARRIESEPWSNEFVHELEHKTIPDVAKGLEEASKVRDSWLKSKRAKLILAAAGLGVGAATAVLTIFTAPITPIALAVAGTGLVSSAVIPGAEWLVDWRDGKKALKENGLHYLVRTQTR